MNKKQFFSDAIIINDEQTSTVDFSNNRELLLELKNNNSVIFNHTIQFYVSILKKTNTKKSFYHKKYKRYLNLLYKRIIFYIIFRQLNSDNISVSVCINSNTYIQIDNFYTFHKHISKLNVCYDLMLEFDIDQNFCNSNLFIQKNQILYINEYKFINNLFNPNFKLEILKYLLNFKKEFIKNVSKKEMNLPRTLTVGEQFDLIDILKKEQFNNPKNKKIKKILNKLEEDLLL